ncbi:MAG TPA: hypothetical protein PKW90_17690 [Myxococcota bacterium]|nr:hypothetical protein [Myxococcota bacterium]
MLLRCEACQAPLKAGSLDARLGIATCPSCGAVMRLDGGRPASLPVPQPPRFTAEPGIDLQVTWPWSRTKGAILLGFSVFWDAALILFVVVGAERGLLAFLPFLSLHILAGLYIFYMGLAHLLNHSRLSMDNGLLRVQHRPLWWPGQTNLETSAIDQLYVMERVHNSKNSRSYSYELMALRTDGIATSVVRNLESVEEGRFLEQQIESRLGITNRPVAGEHPA